MAGATDTFDDGTPTGLRRWLPFVVGAVLLLAAGYWLYLQMTTVTGVKVEAPPTTVVNMLPPPPPPPPPPPEPQVKPPEPTDAPDPVPNPEPAKAPDAPAPMTIAGPPQAGSDSFGLAAGSGGGMGSPGSTGTCLGAKCGTAVGGGGGMGEGLYRRYLSSTLQDRVQSDGQVSRLVFSADFALTVTPDGRVSGVRFLDSRGRKDEAAMQKLLAILAGVRGLDPPPPSMQFPQKVTVRGRRAL